MTHVLQAFRARLFGLLVAGVPSSASACLSCDSPLAIRVRAEVLGPTFWPTLGGLGLTFAIILPSILLIRSRFRRASVARAEVVAAGLMTGVGLGGFIDGILFHQILQFHNMVSARVDALMLVGAKVNMVWDGIFHLGVWAASLAGIFWMWHAARTYPAVSGCIAFYGVLAGWGLFNLIEGAVDHHLLELHHVYEQAGSSLWDWLFLASGVVLLAGGLIAAARTKVPVRSPEADTVAA